MYMAFNYVWQMEMNTVELLISEPRPSEAKIPTEKLRSYKWPGIG
jgi:hypothetical protein